MKSVYLTVTVENHLLVQDGEIKDVGIRGVVLSATKIMKVAVMNRCAFHAAATSIEIYEG